MKKFATALFAVAIMACMIPVSAMAITAYSEDFEALDQMSTSALTDAGWLVFGNVFDSGMNYLYGYGVFGAPNDGAAFCAIATGEGGAGQGMQQLAAFSDYNNADHANGNYIEALVFQEHAILAGNVGETWYFTFDAKRGNLEGASTALAYIKTLDPANGYATTNYVTIDMTAAPTMWGTYTISLDIDASLVGQLFQIGFQSVATNYEGSAVFYDNLILDTDGSVATDATSWDNLKSLYR